jgi:hypothetical protein
VLLAATLAVLGLSKWLLPHPSDAVISAGVAKTIGCMEIVGAVACAWQGARRLVVIATIGLCMVGLVLHLRFPNQPCGCSGGLHGKWHLTLIAGLGFLATLNWFWILNRRKSAEQLQDLPPSAVQ